MSRDPQYFLDILEAAKLAQSYLAGKPKRNSFRILFARTPSFAAWRLLAKPPADFRLKPGLLSPG